MRSDGAFAISFLCALLVALAPGCQRRAAETGQPEESSAGDEHAAPSAPPSDLPRVLVIGPGGGPALFLDSGPEAPAFGYLNPGVRVRLESGIENGRVQVLVAGPLPTKGWVPADRLAAYAQSRGRVEGTPYYLGPNDLVTVLGASADEGRMRIAVRPWMGGQEFLEARIGTFDAELLDDRPVDASTVEGPTEGRCYRLPAGQSVSLYDRPGGQPVLTLPARTPPATVVVLRERAPWYGIRAGYGPYAVGYVQAPLTPCEGMRPPPEPMVPTSEGDAPYWMEQESGNLYRVASGTRVTFGRNPDGTPRTIARLRQEGWAREVRRQEGGLIDAFIAVNDDVAIRGLIPETALTLVSAAEPSAPPPPSEPAPTESEPVPDELAY